LGGHWINIGLPHYVSIDRKPENGCEIQDLCDGKSKIMVRLKLVKGQLDNERMQREDSDDTGLHGTRVLKELVKPWKDSGRLVVGDSYFASVPACIDLYKWGLRFIGVVKTATKQFPQAYLSRVELPTRGDYKGVVNIDDTINLKLLAFVWVDKDRRYFISNCSNLSPGIPYSRMRWRQVQEVESNIEPDRVEVEITQPKCAELYYETCAMIDRHNRSRQDNLQIERKYGNKEWHMRVNLSIVSIIVVDTWNFKHGVLGEQCEETENDFYTLLADEMITNTLDEGRRMRNRYGSPTNESPTRLIGTDGRINSGIGVHLTPTRKRRKMGGEVTKFLSQDWCPECKDYKTTYVCSICNIPFCHTKTGRMCFSNHIDEVHNNL